MSRLYHAVVLMKKITKTFVLSKELITIIHKKLMQYTLNLDNLLLMALNHGIKKRIRRI